MNSLGVIETHGLVAAIQAADAACKAAGVTLSGYRKVGSGRVAICLRGEISAIRAAVDSGSAAVLPAANLLSALVIARPEARVVEALTALKGRSALTPPPAAPREIPPLIDAADMPVPAPAADAADGEAKPAGKKGKKA